MFSPIVNFRSGNSIGVIPDGVEDPISSLGKDNHELLHVRHSRSRPFDG